MKHAILSRERMGHWGEIVKAIAIRSSLPASLILFCVGLLFTAKGGIALATLTGGIAPIWLVNAFAIAWIVNIQPRRALSHLIAAYMTICAANLLGGVSPLTAMGFASVNVAEMATIIFAIERWSINPRQPRKLFALLGICLAAASACSLLAGALLQLVAHAPFVAAVRTWFASDFLGLIIILPASLAIEREDFAQLSSARVSATSAAIMALAALTTWTVFQHSFPLLFLITPCIVLATFRLGFAGAAITNMVVLAIAVLMTTTGHGPIATHLPDLGERMVFLQMFLAVNALTVFPIAAVLDLRRQTFLRLQESERMHRLFAENSSDMIARLSPTGQRLYISPGAERILGYRIGDKLGSNPLAEIHPDDRDLVVRAVEAALAGAHDPMCVFRQRHVDGHYVWLESVFRLVRDPATGEPLEIVVSTRDVSRRHQAERDALAAAARVNEANRLLTLAEASAGFGHWRLDTIDHTVFWSDECCRIHGRDLDYRPTLETGLAAYHPDDVDRVSAVITASTETGKPFEFEARIIRPDGQVRNVLARGQPELTPSGECIGFFGVFQDTTRDVEVRTELVSAREAAEQALAAKSLFTATMSHEIRTPLTTMLGAIDLMAQSEGGVRDLPLFDTLQKSAKLLSGVVDDVLVYSKLNTGTVVVDPVAFDVTEMVGDVVSLFAGDVAAKGLTFSHSVMLATPSLVVGDAVRIQRILANLVGNAIKFTSSGSIDISVSSGRADLHEYLFCVSDTGIGIERDQIDRIFTPFTQADASITRRFGGTGLGLSICRMLAEALGGTISVASVTGHGSVFTVALPLPPAEAKAIAAPAPMPATRSLDVLIAEDNDTNRFLITEMVRAFGHRVTGVENGRQAADTVQQRAVPFDLVLMDAHMPEMDGCEATAEIRRVQRGSAHLPIYAITADVGEDTQNRLIACGMDGVLTKPIQRDLLQRLLARVGGATVEEMPMPAETPPSASVLDESRIQGYDTILGRDVRDQLIGLLVGDVERIPAAIRQHAEAQSFDEMRADVHKLRGAAVSVGARHLIRAIEAIEAVGTECAPDSAVLRDLERSAEEVAAAGRALLASATGADATDFSRAAAGGR